LILYKNKNTFGEYKNTTKTSGLKTTNSSSFQPGDNKAHMPGKLKWGNDF